MKIEFKVLIALFGLILLVLLPYGYVFDGEISSNHTKWAEFGAYLAGTVGILLTLFSVLFVYLTNKKQIDENKKAETLSRLELRSEHILKVINDINNKQCSVIPVVDRLIGDLEWTKLDVTVQESRNSEYTQLINKKLDKVITIKSSSALQLLKTYVDLVGVEKAKQALITENIAFIKSDLASITAHIAYLVEIVKSMINQGYDLFLARYIISTVYDYTKLLRSMGYIEGVLFQTIGMILSAPQDSNIHISINLSKLLTSDLNTFNKDNEFIFGNKVFAEKDMTNIGVDANYETALHEFTITDKTTEKQYKRDVKCNWSEL